VSGSIRLAHASDAAAIAAIYAPYCESTPVSFEVSAPAPEEIAARIQNITTQWPWLVLDDAGVIAGYAYAGRHRERAAYQWAVDTAVYIHDEYRRRGAGRALYVSLFNVLRQQGYFKACAGITLPNAASIALHEVVGFKPVGVYRGIGFKLGSWHDVAWYEAELQPEVSNPIAPRALSAVVDSQQWREAISRGMTHYGRQR
jgi:L-amino acid N-acyltransferase YncA